MSTVLFLWNCLLTFFVILLAMIIMTARSSAKSNSLPSPSLSRTPRARRNSRGLPDRVPDASPVGQPRLRGQPVRALREVRQGPHRPVAQARAPCAPQRAIAPAPDTRHRQNTPPSALATLRGTVLFCIATDDVEESSVNTERSDSE